ncbi:OmpA family protein [Phenylobacterium sp.]|uniref:OmpA family protein n=1 Tax=Phenylobacterium sp. TaxID=1871053 RepID=UPI0035663C83
MTLRSTAGMAMILVLGLGGCAGLKTGRDRIVKTAPSCVDQTVQIYFEAESAEVTKEGRAVITAAAAQGRPCKVASVDVLGLADSVGGPEANLELSKRRAQSVTAALTAAGLPAGEFKVQAAGQAGATTAGGQAKPLRRRVDVVLHLSPT